jgi:hypothetical protein
MSLSLGLAVVTELIRLSGIVEVVVVRCQVPPTSLLLFHSGIERPSSAELSVCTCAYGMNKYVCICMCM